MRPSIGSSAAVSSDNSSNNNNDDTAVASGEASDYRPLGTPPSSPPRLDSDTARTAETEATITMEEQVVHHVNAPTDDGMLMRNLLQSQSPDYSHESSSSDIENFLDNECRDGRRDDGRSSSNNNDDNDDDDDGIGKCVDLRTERLRSKGIVALSLIPLLFCVVLGMGGRSGGGSTTTTTTLGGSSSDYNNEDRGQYSTTVESWTQDQVTRYEYQNTPKTDPTVTYYPRLRDQAASEIANTEEEVRFITNSADIRETMMMGAVEGGEGGRQQAQAAPYTLLVRVVASTDDASQLEETRSRWDATLKQFDDVPAFVRIEVEFVLPEKGEGEEEEGEGHHHHNHKKKKKDKSRSGARMSIKRLFATATTTTTTTTDADWIFVVQDSTYVNLSRLVRRLIADVDPTTSARMGLLVPHQDKDNDNDEDSNSNNSREDADGSTSISTISVPLPEAGILFTRRGLAELWESPHVKSCWNDNDNKDNDEETSTASAVMDWASCTQVADETLTWSPMAGLNPLNVRDMMRQSLEGPLFNDTTISHLYDSVGGPLRGAARLPITYGNMANLDLFHEQLAVDTHRGKVPKILHHIWSGPLENMDKETRRGANECRRMHEERGWEYMLWTDETLKALPGLPHLPYMEGQLKFVRHYVDTVRYYLLHQFGGVYIDMDAFCMRPFDPLLSYAEEKGVDLLMNYESQRHRGRQIANGILVAAPASPVLAAFMLHLGYRLKKHHSAFWKETQYRRAGRITGPWMVTEVRDQWDSWVRDHLYVLSSSAFIPMYREGDEGGLEGSADVFSLAKSQGSYTVQIYHSGALKSLLHGAKTSKTTATAPATVIATKKKEVADHSVELLDSSAVTSIASKENVEDVEVPPSADDEKSVLMVVAHPDDEVIWGGEYLLSNEAQVHVVTTSTINKDTSTRREEFTSVERRLGFEGEFLNGTDSHRTKHIEGHIQRHVQDLVCSQKWDRIITHGPEGEYGHPQHQQVFDTVLEAVRLCCHSFDKLFVFEPHPTENYSFPEDKKEVTDLYASQKRVIEQFDNWKELIVPLADYNYKRASEDCISGALSAQKSKTRKCRLHDMMSPDELSTTGTIPAIFSSGELEGHGVGC